ncbi:AraC family transcriptional regulator [Paenibacillus dendritiformis]|uniref:helix-turn-helix domain-containing protein n=1 Tax=Paenibacillus dendritiformis TaxID=130049 RepID=UPI00105A2062|nr:AraC family transcriptional regulator [Paenibacillus dendritiformis]TDL50290.1 AraC family transcriptional regulator [Paenibacillus dendritiformis]
MVSKKELPTDRSLRTPDRSRKTELNAIKEFMDQHYNESLSIGQLARMANISPKYFVDLFKKTYGLSAMDYLTAVRMNHAKRYLAESGERLRDIALKVGYKDEFYFSRKFKKEVGVSPSDFAKNARRHIAACSSALIGQLLALDVMPVAAPLDPKWTPHYYHALRTEIRSHLMLTAPYAYRPFEVNLNKLVQARPDAIIGTDHLTSLEKAKVNEIAPSLMVSAQDGWRDQLQKIGHFLKREDKAAQWIDRYEQRVQSARTQIGEVLGQDRILALRIYGQRIHIYGNRGLEEVLYHDLKLESACRRGASSGPPLTLEQVAELAPDRILVLICPEAASRAFWLALQHSPEWRKLTAVKNRYVYPIASDPWCEYSAVAITRMLDEALLLFTGNCPNGFLDNGYGESFAT